MNYHYDPIAERAAAWETMQANNKRREDEERTRPFRFEDLNGKPEPEAWGPKYSKPQKARRVNDETNIPTNCASGQKGDFSAAKHRAKIKAEFAAVAHAERRAWANGLPRPGSYNKKDTIVQAYERAMAEKRARQASTIREAA
jgi:hypothetical protein